MPVEVLLGNKKERVEMKNGEGKIRVPRNITPVVDPEKWILRE